MHHTRTETDSMGAVEVPADRLWGAQTQRSLVHFQISTEKMPLEMMGALARIKAVYALAVGTGLNTHPEFGARVADALARSRCWRWR